jgi:hypothetical protein
MDTMTTSAQTPSVITSHHSPTWDDSYSPDDGTPLTQQRHPRVGNISQFGIAYSPSSGREIREGSMYIPEASLDAEFSRSILMEFNETESQMHLSAVPLSMTSASVSGPTSIFQSVMQGSGVLPSKVPDEYPQKTQSEESEIQSSITSLELSLLNVDVYVENMIKSVDEFFVDKKYMKQDHNIHEQFGRKTLLKLANDYTLILISGTFQKILQPPIHLAFTLSTSFTRELSQIAPQIRSSELNSYIPFSADLLKLFRVMTLSMIQTKTPDSIKDGVVNKELADQVIVFVCIAQISFQVECLRLIYCEIGGRIKTLSSNVSKILKMCRKDVGKSIEAAILKIQLFKDSSSFSSLDWKNSLYCTYDVSTIINLICSEDKFISKSTGSMMVTKITASLEDNRSSSLIVKSVSDSILNSFRLLREKLHDQYSCAYFNPEVYLNELLLPFLDDESESDDITIARRDVKSGEGANKVSFSFFNFNISKSKAPLLLVNPNTMVHLF